MSVRGGHLMCLFVSCHAMASLSLNFESLKLRTASDLNYVRSMLWLICLYFHRDLRDISWLAWVKCTNLYNRLRRAFSRAVFFAGIFMLARGSKLCGSLSTGFTNRYPAWSIRGKIHFFFNVYQFICMQVLISWDSSVADGRVVPFHHKGWYNCKI